MFLEVVNFPKIYEKIQQAKQLQLYISETEARMTTASQALVALGIKTSNLKKLVQDIDSAVGRTLSQTLFKVVSGAISISTAEIDAAKDQQIRAILLPLLGRNITSSAVDKQRKNQIAFISKEVAKYGMKASDFNNIMKKIPTITAQQEYVVYTSDGYFITFGAVENPPSDGGGSGGSGSGGDSGGSGSGGSDGGSGGSGSGGDSGGSGSGGGSNTISAKVIDLAFFYPNYFSNPFYINPIVSDEVPNLHSSFEVWSGGSEDITFNPNTYFDLYVELYGVDLTNPEQIQNKLLIEIVSDCLDGSGTFVTGQQTYANAVYFQTSRYVPGQDPIAITPGRFEFQRNAGHLLLRRGSHLGKILYSADGGNSSPWEQIGTFNIDVLPSLPQ